MRKMITRIVAFVFLTSAMSSLLGAAKEPPYRSQKPLYAFMVLDEEYAKVLELVLDESEGTGKGYDTLYADFNLNGNLTDDEVLKGTMRKSESILSCRFPAIESGVPYNEKGKGVEKPWEITISYVQYGMGQGEQMDRRFSLAAKVRLKDESEVWEYSFLETLYRVEKPEGVPAADFAGKVTLLLETKPDQEKEGHTGIAAYLRVGPTSFRCGKGGQPAIPRLQIKDAEGKIIHSEDVSIDKLRFG